MSSVQPQVNELFIRRNAWGSPIAEALQKTPVFLTVMLICLSGGFIWPLLTPFLLIIAVITPLTFFSQRWRCPMRMPITLDQEDPSEDRYVKADMFPSMPALLRFPFQKRATRKARGVFFFGFRRLSDVGRELWLTADDLTRHIMFFATTGGGKTESLYSFMLNPLCHARGFTMMDGKAQNDTARTIWYLALRFGREDDVEFINFMTGGRSRSEIIHSGDKSRPESNTFNPFAYGTETLITETMQSMLPQNVQGGEWQSRAIAMIKALVFGVKYLCVIEKRVMSMHLLRHNMSLENMAELYAKGIDDCWPDEAVAPLKNYLTELPGFDLGQVRNPSAWTEEPRKQHNYLTGQFSETFATFTETYGHIFPQDAGDVDLRDSIHSDRIMIVMIPSLELSTHSSSALGKILVTQQSMILSRDLGNRVGGTDEEALEVKKYPYKFPYISFMDEIGAYYTERITAMATQVRSLFFCLFMAAQDAERMFGATSAENVATLMQNAGIKTSGKIVSNEKTMAILNSAAGKEAQAKMTSLQRQDSLLGTAWLDDDKTSIVLEDKIQMKDLDRLQPGENVTLFNGNPVPGSTLYIQDEDKTAKIPVHINRLIQVEPLSLERLRRLVPRAAERYIPQTEKLSRLTGILSGELANPMDLYTLQSPVLWELSRCEIKLGLQTVMDLRPDLRARKLYSCLTDLLSSRSRHELAGHLALRHAPSMHINYEIDHEIKTLQLDQNGTDTRTSDLTANDNTPENSDDEKSINIDGLGDITSFFN